MDRSCALGVLVLALVLSACGAADDAGVPDGAATPTEVTTSPTSDPEESATMDATLSGTFGGDAVLEGGCAWLDVDGERYEVLWPEGYEVAFDPLRLLGPDGETVAADGDAVAVAGAPAEGMASVCQVGPLFRADQVLDPG